jgi:hypothetical protein
LKNTILKIIKDYLNEQNDISIPSIRLLDGVLLEMEFFKDKFLENYLIER